MTLPENINTLEKAKFAEDGSGNVLVRTSATGSFSQTGLSLGMAVSAVTVTDVASKVPLTPLVGRNTMTVRVWGSNTVYFGDSTVTAASGYPKLQYEEISIDIKDASPVELWAVCASGLTSEVRVLEVS